MKMFNTLYIIVLVMILIVNLMNGKKKLELNIALKKNYQLFIITNGLIVIGAAVSHQWIKASEYHGDLSLVSAFAIEFDFSQDLLEPGETITIHVKMTAPEYGTDQIDEISNKLMANSALIAVLRNGSEEVLSTDITENREVKAQLSLPKGTIGDFAWYDINRNGLQDQSDVPVQGFKSNFTQICNNI